MAAAVEPLPSWGSLPVERYLLLNWDDTKTCNPDEQRHFLIRQFLQLPEVPFLDDWETRPPPAASQSRIDTILRPWRPDSVRAAAVDLLRIRNNDLLHRDFPENTVWLRTHYPADHDAHEEPLDKTHAAMTEASEQFGPGCPESDARLLDNKAVWAAPSPDETPDEALARLLPLLPELACHTERSSRGFVYQEAAEFMDELRVSLREEVEAALGVGGTESAAPPEAKAAVIEASEAAKSLQLHAVARLLVVADRQAFETGDVGILWLDGWGRVVRWLRVPPLEMANLAAECYEAMLNESCLMFDDGVTGGLAERYRAFGEVGRELYGIF